jgi:hypothetical protein
MKIELEHITINMIIMTDLLFFKEIKELEKRKSNFKKQL